MGNHDREREAVGQVVGEELVDEVLVQGEVNVDAGGEREERDRLTWSRREWGWCGAWWQ